MLLSDGRVPEAGVDGHPSGWRRDHSPAGGEPGGDIRHLGDRRLLRPLDRTARRADRPEAHLTITSSDRRPVNSFGPARSGIGRYRDERPLGREKATVLLLHGWAGTAELNWSHVYAPLVSAGYRVLAPDLAGHGHGAKDVAFTIEGSADAVARLVMGSGAARVVVVGHSMGGSVALVFARRHPDWFSAWC